MNHYYAFGVIIRQLDVKLYRGCKEKTPQFVYTIEIYAGDVFMVDCVIPMTNQDVASKDEQVELQDGRVILIDPEGLVALALEEFGAVLVDVKPAESEIPELPEAA
jgi:hypothetical protein